MASTTMYSCQPYIDPKPDISLPTCMYEMKNIQNSQGVAFEEKDGEQSQNQEIAKLLERQLKILDDLNDIKRQMDSLQKKAGVKNEDLKKIGHESRKEADQATPSFQDEDLDIVITANPSNPPISAFVLFNYFCQQGITLSSACHKHSNLKEAVPFDVMKSIGWQDSLIQPHQKLNLTFIWKEDPFGPSIIVSPRVQTPIKGDGNIARFLCRRFSPQLYESLSENGTLMADFLMDLATTKIITGSVEETKKALTQVEKQLGKNTWLVENKFTIADVVMFSAIRVNKNIGLLSHNLERWFKSIEAKYC